MSWERSIFQTFRHVNPTQSILVEHERRIAGNCVQPFCAQLRFVVGRFSLNKSGNIDAGPFVRVPVPPHQFFPFAPRTPIRSRTSAIVNDPPITRPGEPPAMAEVISRLSRVRLVHSIATENTRVDPATARSRTVGFQFSKTVDLRSVMRIAVAIQPE